MKGKVCPACGHRFSGLTEPKLKSTSDIRGYVCNACGAQLKIVGGIWRQLWSLALFGAAPAVIIGAKWIAYSFLPNTYAGIAWFIVSILTLGCTIALVSASFAYEVQPGVPADGTRPAGSAPAKRRR